MRDSSFLESKYCKQISLINDFEDDFFANINKLIKELIFKSSPHKVHTTIQGVRRVDFKFVGDVDMVAAFTRKNYLDLI